MKSLSSRFSYGAWRTLSMLPLRLMYVLSDAAYYLLYYIVRYRRKVVRRNLCKSFPEKDMKEIVKIEKRFFHTFCDSIVEMVKIMSMDENDVKKHLRFEGTELVEKALKEQDKSCVVYIGHNMNWEFITSLPLHFNPEDNIVFGQIYHPLENASMDQLVINLREQYGSTCISMSNTLRYIVSLTREKRKFVIGFIADQVPTWESIGHWLDFMHQETPVFTGTEKIAQRTASAVFYMSMEQTARGQYTATFHKMCDDASLTSEHELTEQYFRMLEDNIRQHPHLWLWTHKRWKRTRQGMAEREESRKRERAEKMKNN